MPGRPLADAIVVISPDTRYFRTLADTQLRKELAGLNPKIRIGLDQKAAQTALAAFQVRVKAVSEQLNNMRMDVKGDKAAEAKIAAAQVKVLAITKAMASMTMAADTKKLDAQILAKQAEVRKLQASMSKFKMDADATKLALKIAKLEAEARSLEKQLEDMDVDADVSVLEAKFNAVHAELALLKRDASDLDLVMNNVAALRSIAVARAELAALQQQARDTRLGVEIDPAKIAAFEVGLLGIEAAMQKLDETTKKAHADSNAFVGIISGTRWWNISILGVGAWHVVLDGLLETLIAVTGATIALTAGVLGVADAAQDVGIHLKGVWETSAALHQVIPPLSGSFKALSAAMAPRTIELFGGGLDLMASQTGNLLHEIEPVVNLFDTWIAKIDLWVGAQHQFGKAVSGGLVYLDQFGQIFGNLGIAITNLLSKDPGIAELLGKLIIAGTQLLVAFSKLPGPLVETALALHGIYLWGKVLVAAPILAFAKSLGILSTAQVKAAENALHFRNILSFFLTNPFGWAIAAAASLSFLGYQLAQADAHARNFIGGLEQGLQELSGGQAILAISSDIGQLNAEISRVPARIGNTELTLVNFARNAGHSFNQVSYDLNKGNIPGALADIGRTAYNAVRAFMGWANIGPVIRQAENDTGAYRGEIIKLTREQSKMFAVTGRLVTGQNDLHIGAVSLTQAWALMDIAGVKASDRFDVMWQKVENLVAGYKGLSVQGGILKNSVNAISFAALQQESKVSDLNSAWDAFFKTVTGGESGFLSFAQQTIGLFRVMDQTSLKMNESNGKVSTSMNGLAKASKGTTVSMTGLNDVSINARETFLRSAEAANAQVDSLTLLASAAGLGAKGTDLLSRATKDMVASLLPAASRSRALTSVLYALAQRGGYGGANSFKALSEWAGKTKDPLKDLDSITTTLTTDAANLTDDIKNLSVALGQTLNTAMAAAILQAGGGQKVFDAFATAVLHTAFNSKQQQAAATNLAGQLLALTGNANDARNEFITFAQQMHLSREQASQLWDEIRGKLTPSLVDQANRVLPHIRGAFSDWARLGLSQSKDEANHLWSTLTGKLGPYLNNNLASAVLSSKQKFEAWAGPAGNSGLGLTKKQAGALYDELRTLQGYINNMHGKNISIVMVGNASYQIKDLGTGTTQAIGTHTAAGRGAGGMLISAGTGPTADDVPVWASRGEFITRASSVAKYGIEAMNAVNQGQAVISYAAGGAVRKFAGGGAVQESAGGGAVREFAGASAYAGGGLLSYAQQAPIPRLYPFPGDLRNTTQNAMQAETVRLMTAALRASEAAARKAFLAARVPNVGSGVARWLPVVLQALALNHEPSSLARQVLYQIQTESGGNPNAINLTDINAQHGDPSRGLLQVIGATFDTYHIPGTSWNIYDPLANVAAAINYARHVYGPSLMRGGQGLGSGHGYALGGLIRKMAAGGLVGMASGGRIPLGKYLPQLKTAQRNEAGDYGGLRKAYLTDLAHAKAGSWTSGHRAGITSELGTLAKRQTAEVAAYNAIISHGTSGANLKAMASKVRAVATTSRDKDLSHSHPGWTHGLQYWLGVLTHLAQADVAPVYGGSQVKLQFGPWLARLKAAEKDQEHDLFWLFAAFYHGLTHAGKGSWLYKNKTAVRQRLYALALKDKAEDAAYKDLVSHATGSAANLDAMAGRIRKVGSTARTELNAVQPALLGHRPGGYPAQVRQVQDSLRLLIKLTSTPPFNPAWVPGNLGPSHTAIGGVLQFDTGRGVLAPGMNLAWNGTGRNEPLSSNRAGGSQPVVLEFAGGGGSDLEQLLFQIIRRTVRVRGGGNVQTAFGRGS